MSRLRAAKGQLAGAEMPVEILVVKKTSCLFSPERRNASPHSLRYHSLRGVDVSVSDLKSGQHGLHSGSVPAAKCAEVPSLVYHIGLFSCVLLPSPLAPPGCRRHSPDNPTPIAFVLLTDSANLA